MMLRMTLRRGCAVPVRCFASRELCADELHLVLSKARNTADVDTAARFSTLLNTLDDDSLRSAACAEVLRVVRPSTKNRDVLIAALKNVNVYDVGFETLLNLINVMNTLGRANVRNLPEGRHLAVFFSAYCDRNPKVVRAVEKSMEDSDNTFTGNILISLYLKTNQLEKAYAYFVKCAEEGDRLRASSLELLLIHCSSRDKLDKVRKLLHIAKVLRYPIYPRTYSELFSRAIVLGDSEFCREHLTTILSETFIDNGSLVALAELLHGELPVEEMINLYKLSSRKGSLTPELHGRMRHCVAENFARTVGFRKAYRFLKRTHQKGMLRVIDYPNLLEKFESTSRVGRSDTYLAKMAHTDPTEMKSFYLSLTIAKNIQRGQLESIISLIRDNARLLRHMNEESIWQLVQGLRQDLSIPHIGLVLDLLNDSKLEIRSRRVADHLVALTLHSELWFRTFRDVLDLITIPNYKLPPSTASTFIEICERENISVGSYQRYL